MDDDPRRTRLAMLAETDDGWTHSAELVSAVLAWTAIGWGVDHWLGTGPWMLVGGAVLGFVLGTYLLWLQIRGGDH